MTTDRPVTVAELCAILRRVLGPLLDPKYGSAKASMAEIDAIEKEIEPCPNQTSETSGGVPTNDAALIASMGASTSGPASSAERVLDREMYDWCHAVDERRKQEAT